MCSTSQQGKGHKGALQGNRVMVIKVFYKATGKGHKGVLQGNGVRVLRVFYKAMG